MRNMTNERARQRSARKHLRQAGISPEELTAIDRNQAGIYRLDPEEVAHWRETGEDPDHGRVALSAPYELQSGLVVMRWWKV
jgi:hypothetical protein